MELESLFQRNCLADFAPWTFGLFELDQTFGLGQTSTVLQTIICEAKQDSEYPDHKDWLLWTLSEDRISNLSCTTKNNSAYQHLNSNSFFLSCNYSFPFLINIPGLHPITGTLFGFLPETLVHELQFFDLKQMPIASYFSFLNFRLTLLTQLKFLGQQLWLHVCLKTQYLCWNTFSTRSQSLLNCLHYTSSPVAESSRIRHTAMLTGLTFIQSSASSVLYHFPLQQISLKCY